MRDTVISLKNESQRIEIADFLKVPKEILSSDSSRYGKEEAFCLLYIKMEQQLRKLVCYLLRSDPHLIHWNHIESYISEHRDWKPNKWLVRFDQLQGRGEFKKIVETCDPSFIFRARKKELETYERRRDLIFHGVNIQKDFFVWFNTEDRSKFLIEWIETVAKSMDMAIGYDGIQLISALKNNSREYRFSKSDEYNDAKNYINSRLKDKIH